MRFFHAIIAGVFLCSTAIAFENITAPEIKLAYGNNGDVYTGKLVALIYQEAFKRLDINLSIITCPPLNCSLMVKEKLVDGELSRSKTYQRVNPQAIRLLESAYSAKIAAYAINCGFAVKGWDSFTDTDLKVGCVIGYPYCDEQLKNRGSGLKIVKLPFRQSGINKLLNGDIDVLIGNGNNVDCEIRKQMLVYIKNIGVIQELPLYAYLGKKHKLLKKDLEVILKKMKSDGSIESIYQGLNKEHCM